MTAWVYPEKGREAEVATDLLALADSPSEVATNTDNGLCFVVTDKIADLYAEKIGAVTPEEPVTPRRGRPRKETT